MPTDNGSPPRSRERVVMLLENQPYPADVRVRAEAEALARAGYRVKVIAPRAPGEPARQSVRGVAVSRYRLPPERSGIFGLLAEYLVANLQLHARATAELARGAQILHIHNPPDTLFAVAWAARALGVRVVFDHHDLAPELFAVKFGARHRVLQRALRALEFLTFRSASHVLAANESHRGVALARGRLAPDAVTVVRNGPPARTLSELAPSGGALAAPRLVFVGSMAAQDGVLELPEILHELERRHGLRPSLVAVGDGPSRPELERRCRELGLTSRVRFTGRVEPEAVPGFLVDADVCVDPAPCNQLNHCSTMVKIAEYLAAGRPLVAYRLNETAHTVGDAALLAPCDDRAAFVDNVARLARDGALRHELARRGRERVAGLTWEKSERALITAYAQL